MCDLSTAAFPFLAIRADGPRPDAGASSAGSPSPAISATRSGCRRSTSARCSTCCWAAGEDLGIGHFGGRALNSLRLEKSFGTWAREYRPIYGPYEAGLGRFVRPEEERLHRPRRARRRRRTSGGVRAADRRSTVDANDADAIGDEPVWHDGKVVGWVTSGGYGHTVGKSVALGYVEGAGRREQRVRGRNHRRAAPGGAQRGRAGRSAGLRGCVRDLAASGRARSCRARAAPRALEALGTRREYVPVGSRAPSMARDGPQNLEGPGPLRLLASTCMTPASAVACSVSRDALQSSGDQDVRRSSHSGALRQRQEQACPG